MNNIPQGKKQIQRIVRAPKEGDVRDAGMSLHWR
jgi:hypothetical protein